MTERKDYNYLRAKKELAKNGELRDKESESTLKEREERIKQEDNIPNSIEVDSKYSGVIRNKKTGETVYNYKLAKKQLNIK